jgi:hypothetical protein
MRPYGSNRYKQTFGFAIHPDKLSYANQGIGLRPKCEHRPANLAIDRLGWLHRQHNLQYFAWEREEQALFCGKARAMEHMQWIGRVLIAIGAVLVLVGAVLYAAGDKLDWLGRLPGDIRVERPGLRIYFPFTTMLLLSLVFTLIRTLLRKWW